MLAGCGEAGTVLRSGIVEVESDCGDVDDVCLVLEVEAKTKVLFGCCVV